MSFGASLDNHRDAPTSYLPDANPGHHGGGTYTANSMEPTLEAYENIFGPSARDIKQDLQRFKRHGRWHLPDILKGPNQYLTDRVDGLITDATSSPFTSRILPYKYITNVDGKIKWNVWSFDEGLASRVPYESAARTLTQTKRSFAGYFIRQGMAIVLEHNFMMTEAGRENFKRQLNQLVGSIQLTNDLDVHVALVLAPSYQKTMNERYLTQDKSSEQICREFVELFGFVQKNQNALDILIEEAKGQLKTWGAPMPDFMLCNSKLTFQLTMTPDATNYVTQGPEGQKKLKTGPTLSSYRGIGIVHTRAFSMETGAPPRDMLRRRVRVAEYYRIPPHRDNHKRLFELYNEGRDTWSSFTFQDLLQKAHCGRGTTPMEPGPGQDNDRHIVAAARSMSMSASGAHHVQPETARLGERIGGDEIDVTSRGSLTYFFDQLINEKAEKDFTFEPIFVSDKMVFVPGALDVFDKAEVIDKDIRLQLPNLPDYLKQGVQNYLENHGTSTLTLEEENRIKIVMQSVAPYHRNTRAVQFFKSRKVDIFAYQKPPKWDLSDLSVCQAAVTVASGSRTPQQKRDVYSIKIYEGLMLRNYLRFGIPTELLGGFGLVHKSIKRALDLGKTLKSGAGVINYYDQTLRDLGAWFCPNHFKQPDLSFSNIGDQLGYHMILTHDWLKDLTARTVDDTHDQDVNSYHQGTYLHDIVQYKERYTGLYKKVKEILAEARLNLQGTGHNRASLSNSFGERLRTEIIFARGGFDKYNTFVNNHFYWFFPRTTNCQEEVFCSDARARSTWKNQLWNLPKFQETFRINTDVVKEMETNSMDHTDRNSLNYHVVFPMLPEVTDNDVRNFFCMLAWRLWADQEISVSMVYNMSTGIWPPSVDAFLFPPQNYPYPQFGHGVIKYGDPSMLVPPGTNLRDLKVSQETEHVEVVIVRPNIEHYMMGIILGQGGESLGSTFWGQTELSCYDDSMHGIWGMSYKYHERAIVINERNLVRLWDIAYDGYVGGKDDTSVNWDDESESPQSKVSFFRATTDVTRPYRGPSMMVMAFHHLEGKNTSTGSLDAETLYKKHYNANWPSPIVFYDRFEQGDHQAARADFDNLHAVEVEQFRVFNNPLYRNAYRPYREHMPNFWELHTIRKNAGLAATENEVSSDALAFQGTMRVKSAETGAVIHEVLGSGHHGPDFIGVASLRAGKGYRLNSQPTVHRLV